LKFKSNHRWLKTILIIWTVYTGTRIYMSIIDRAGWFTFVAASHLIHIPIMVCVSTWPSSTLVFEHPMKRLESRETGGVCEGKADFRGGSKIHYFIHEKNSSIVNVFDSPGLLLETQVMVLKGPFFWRYS